MRWHLVDLELLLIVDKEALDMDFRLKLVAYLCFVFICFCILVCAQSQLNYSCLFVSPVNVSGSSLNNGEVKSQKLEAKSKDYFCYASMN